MEKIIYLAWRKPDVDFEMYAERLRSELTPYLQEAGVRGLKLNLADSAVKPAMGLRQSLLKPPVESLVQIWVDSAVARFRKPVDAAIERLTSRYAAYLVTESQPLRNLKQPPEPGKRTAGFAQIALLRRPEKLAYAAWLDVWHNSHTDVAIETQSTFEYIQNVVVRPLTADAPPVDAIVEECFPSGAMTDYKVFFDAPGDEAKFKRNLQRMMESVSRFIEPGSLDVIPTSQYLMLQA
ncbi:MAG: EthD domain-containing protein [Nevskiales bacterium]